jgi:hypothetical protein
LVFTIQEKQISDTVIRNGFFRFELLDAAAAAAAHRSFCFDSVSGKIYRKNIKNMAKRNLEDFEGEISENKRFLEDLQGDKKHTLDSDESDNEEAP